MRYGNIITKIFVITLFFFSLVNCGLYRELQGSEGSKVLSVSVVTDPPGARLVLVNIKEGGTTVLSTGYSPNVVYYRSSPWSGTYLLISHPGYTEEVINLKETTYKRVRVIMKPGENTIPRETEPGAFFMGFGSIDNMPDLSYVADEDSVADLINEALVPLSNSPFIDGAIVSIVNLEYLEAKAFTGKIHISSKEPGAELLLDGRPMGTTPKEIIGLQTGAHRIALIKKGYEVWTKQVTIVEKQEKRIVVQMLESSPSSQSNSKISFGGSPDISAGAKFKRTSLTP